MTDHTLPTRLRRNERVMTTNQPRFRDQRSANTQRATPQWPASFTEALIGHAPRIALKHKYRGEWYEFTFSDVAREAAQFAGALARAGFGRTDRLLLLGELRPRLIWAALAALRLGGTVVLLGEGIADGLCGKQLSKPAPCLPKVSNIWSGSGNLRPLLAQASSCAKTLAPKGLSGATCVPTQPFANRVEQRTSSPTAQSNSAPGRIVMSSQGEQSVSDESHILGQAKSLLANAGVARRTNCSSPAPSGRRPTSSGLPTGR